MALTTVRPDGVGFDTGRRNMLINGAMQVAQRGTTFWKRLPHLTQQTVGFVTLAHRLILTQQSRSQPQFLLEQD